jgi:hypothetical protein
MSRAVTTRVGLYFGLLQLVFGITWVVYAVYLPQLGAQAGISRGTVSWILVGDQLIFALCDWAVGVAADRIAKVVGRLGRLIVALTLVSTAAFLLIPLVTRSGATIFVLLIAVWAVTSSALRAPPLALLGRHTPAGQQPWVGALFVVGSGVATALTPFLAGAVAEYDPRTLFGASAVSVLVVTLSIVWAERTLARDAAPQDPVATEIRMATLLWFLGAVLLLQVGFQVHFFTNAQLLFAKYAQPTQLPALLALFWIGFAALTPLAAFLVKRVGGIACMMWCALVAAGSAWAAGQATDVVSLGIAQVICGGAWGGVMAGAVAAAFTIGRRGRAGAAAGALFSVVALATMGRIALVAAHGDRVPAVASALPWLPSLSWLAATLLLVPLAGRITSATRRAAPAVPADRRRASPDVERPVRLTGSLRPDFSGQPGVRYPGAVADAGNSPATDRPWPL